MKDLALTAALFMISGVFGYLMGVMTEREQSHKRLRDYRLDRCHTYTDTKTEVKYTYGGKND